MLKRRAAEINGHQMCAYAAFARDQTQRISKNNDFGPTADTLRMR